MLGTILLLRFYSDFISGIIPNWQAMLELPQLGLPFGVSES